MLGLQEEELDGGAVAQVADALDEEAATTHRAVTSQNASYVRDVCMPTLA